MPEPHGDELTLLPDKDRPGVARPDITIGMTDDFSAMSKGRACRGFRLAVGGQDCQRQPSTVDSGLRR